MGRIKRVVIRPLEKQPTKPPLSRILLVKVEIRRMSGDHRSLVLLDRKAHQLMEEVQLLPGVEHPEPTTRVEAKAVECQGRALMKAAELLLPLALLKAREHLKGKEMTDRSRFRVRSLIGSIPSSGVFP